MQRYVFDVPWLLATHWSECCSTQRNVQHKQTKTKKVEVTLGREPWCSTAACFTQVTFCDASPNVLVYISQVMSQSWFTVAKSPSTRFSLCVLLFWSSVSYWHVLLLLEDSCQEMRRRQRIIWNKGSRLIFSPATYTQIHTHTPLMCLYAVAEWLSLQLVCSIWATFLVQL